MYLNVGYTRFFVFIAEEERKERFISAMAFRFYELASKVKDFIVTYGNVWLVDNYRRAIPLIDPNEN